MQRALAHALHMRMDALADAGQSGLLWDFRHDNVVGKLGVCMVRVMHTV